MDLRLDWTESHLGQDQAEATAFSVKRQTQRITAHAPQATLAASRSSTEQGLHDNIAQKCKNYLIITTPELLLWKIKAGYATSTTFFPIQTFKTYFYQKD